MNDKMVNMKAVVYKKYGSPEVLLGRKVTAPAPSTNEVLIKIMTTTVTSADVKLRKANPFLVRLYNGLLKPRNQVLGTEFSGIIHSIGENVTNYNIGDKVFGFCGFGSYSEYLCLPETGVFTLKPDNLTHEEAAAVPFGALSALYFLKQSKIQPGNKVMIYGASGSVGTYAIQLAKVFHTYVTAICSTRNIPLVTSIGADKVIDYAKKNWMADLEQQDVIFDTVGKLQYNRSLLSPKGKFTSTSINLDLIKDYFISKLNGSSNLIIGMARETKEDLEFVRNLIVQNKLKPIIDRSYSLDQIKLAHEYVESGKKRGNLVITVQ